MKKTLFAGIIILLGSLQAMGTTFTVTNTNDSGTNSLRELLGYANVISGTHTIEFNIPVTDPNYDAGTGTWTIHANSPLGYITSDNITIDGTTQTANQGDTNPYGPEIVLDGNNNSVDYAFSIINSSNIHIKGLCIVQFTIGIQIFGNSSANNTIKGNYIGITANSADTAGNYIGVEIIGGPHDNLVGGNTAADRNVVSGNEHIGIRVVDASNNTITGNYVGLDRTGMIAMGNYDGISIEGAATYNTVGGLTAGERNVVAGNYAYGVPVFGAGCNNNLIIGNYIGVNANGNVAVPNTYGVLFDDGAAFNIIGGDSPAHRNILSGNSGYGVFIYNMGTHNNLVKGNYIGTDYTGMVAVPNANGIVVDGAPFSNVIDSNLISGNLQQGIAIHITGTDSTHVYRNLIGTDITGTGMLGNGMDGIRIGEGPRNSFIGGSPSLANVIAFNGSNGVSVMNDVDDYHLISCNSIYGNYGLGIDLYLPGVNQNDAGDGDTGPNQGMNYPVIDTVIYLSGTGETIIMGTLDTQNPEYCAVEIFEAAPDPGNYGEGKTYISTVTPDISGNWADTITGFPDGVFYTTTATDAMNNTSEFSLVRNSLYPAHIPHGESAGCRVFPNPSSGSVTITGNHITSCRVYDTSGKMILDEKPVKATQTIQLNQLPGGMYTLCIESASGTETYKLIIR